MAPAVADTASVMTNTATAAITAAVEEAATDDAFVYENVFGAGTRVKYYNTSLGIKEDIILDYNIGKNRFDFEIDTGGDIPILTEDAAMILVYDKDDPEQLNYRFGTLYAYDSYTGEPSETGFRHLTEDCYYELTSLEGSKYRVTVVVPDEWLDHPELVYPVTIDPTVNNAPTNIDDTYVRESAATTNYYLESRLRIGNYNGTNYTSGKCHTFIRFITMPSLTNATVTQATLKMSLLSGQTSAQPARTWRVTSSWSGSSLTWNNRPSNSESSPITLPVGVSHYNFEVGAIVNSWYNGAANYGFLINYNNSTYADLNSLYSSDCGISYYLPTLTFTYVTNYAPITNGTYFIRNQKSGHYLDAFSAGGSGTNVGQYAFHGDTNQQWILTHKGGGYYQIVPVYNTNLSLDISNGGGANGTNVQVYNHTVYSAQRWKIIANANGTYRIASKCSNDTRVLTVANASTASGANVVQYQYNGSGNDEWVFERATFSGNSYTTLTNGVAKTGTISQGGEYWYKFIPSINKEYTFTTTGSIDTYGELYQGSKLLLSDDDTGQGHNFKITHTLVLGAEYMLKVRGYNSTTTGNYSICIGSTDPFHSDNIEYIRMKKYDQSVVGGDSDITTVVTKSYINSNQYFEAYAPGRQNVAFTINSSLINELNAQENSFQEYPTMYLPNFYYHLAKLGVDEMVDNNIIEYGSAEYYGIWASESNRLLIEANKISNQIQLTLATVTAIYSIYSFVSSVRAMNMSMNTTKTYYTADYRATAHLADDLLDNMTNNPNSNTVMLGTNANGVSYNQVAAQQGRSYFYSTNYDNYVNQYGSDAMLATNRTFISNAKDAGKTFWFSHDPIQQLANSTYANSTYTYELKYLEQIYGITISESNIFKSGEYWYLIP